MKKTIMSLVVVNAMLASPIVLAAGSHDHGHDNAAHHDTIDKAKHDHNSHDHGQHDGMSQDGVFLVEKDIDGYQVSFHVMETTPGMEHGGKHNLMIKIADGDKVLHDVKVNSKVVYPNGDNDSRSLMRMGDWYMNGYDLDAKGKHQLMILFKTADGKKHKGGVYYRK